MNFDENMLGKTMNFENVEENETLF